MPICIWPYHCIKGTKGIELEENLAKTIEKYAPIFIRKGMDSYTEMFGIIKPEYNPDNYINKEVLDLIESHEQVYIAGEAKSHCVLRTIEQIIEYFENQPEILERITILENCMSSITGYEEQTENKFKEFEKYKIRFIK